MSGLEARFLTTGAILLCSSGWGSFALNFRAMKSDFQKMKEIVPPGGNVSTLLENAAGAALWLGTILLWCAVATRGTILEKLPGGNLYEAVILLSAILPTAGLILGFDSASPSLGITVVLAGSMAMGASTLPISWPGPAPAVFDPVMMSLHAYPAMAALALTLLGSAAASAKLAENASFPGCLVIAGFLSASPGAIVAFTCFWTSAGTVFPPIIAGISATVGFCAVFCAIFGARGWRIENSTDNECLAVRCMRLAAGAYVLFGIGAGMVWAAMEWGRPWGWDLKEIGALVCALYYVAAAGLHGLGTRVDKGMGGEDRTWAVTLALRMTAAGGLLALGSFIGIGLSGLSLHGYAN